MNYKLLKVIAFSFLLFASFLVTSNITNAQTSCADVGLSVIQEPEGGSGSQSTQCRTLFKTCSSGFQCVSQSGDAVYDSQGNYCGRQATCVSAACSINSFTADNTSPAYNTGTTLRFSLSGSFPWSISRLSGSVSPTPASGTGSSGTSSTGNLTVAHMYRLTCGSATSDITVTPQFTVRALVSGSGGSVSPASQTTTGSPVDISVSADSGFSANVPQFNPPGCSTLSGSYTSSSKSRYHTGDISNNCDFTFTFSQAAPAPVCGSTHYACSSGTSGNNVPGSTSWTWTCDNGSTTVNCSETAPPLPMSGTLSAPSSCTITIASGGSSCNATLSWNTTNPQGTSNVTSSYPAANTLVGSGNSGSQSALIPYSSRNFYLYNSGLLLDQKTVTANCASGTVWSSSQGICVSAPATDGSCANAHYNCTYGTSSNNVDGASSWTWTCAGTNGGNPASCSEAKNVELTASVPSPTTAVANTALTFSSNITNTGNIPTPSSFYNLFQVTNAGGTVTDLLPAASTAVLASGAMRTVTSPSYTFPAAGTYSVRACADKSSASSSGTITESNENNNCSSWTNVTVSATPYVDLAAGTVSPATATVNTAQTFSAPISNSGNGSTNASFSYFFQTATGAGGTGTVTDLSSATMSALAAGTSDTATKSYTFASTGTYSMRVCADKTNATSSGTIAESNENNNCGAWTDIAVGSTSAPDLAASAPTPYNATVNVSQTFSSTLTNVGTVSTGTSSFSYFFQLATSSNGGGTVTDLSSSTTPALAAGASSSVSRSYTFTSTGGYSIRACADKTNASSSGTITESNENNNCSSWTNVTVSAPNNGNGNGDGGWSAWSTCSVTCGGGYQTRTCTNPVPSGGADCSNLDGGNSVQACNTGTCAGNPLINGACYSSHYFCMRGLSTSNVNGTDSWTWTCAGANGGTPASCSETKKRPTFQEN